MARCIAELDNGKHGLIFPSGCGTVTAVLHLLNSGDHIVSSFIDESKKHGIEVDYVDTTDIKMVENAIKPNTKVKNYRFI